MSYYVKNFSQSYPLNLSLQKRKIFSFVLERPLVLNIVLVFFILFFIIFQFVLVNRMAIYGFKIKELEEKKRTLEEEKKNLELEIIKTESRQGMEDYFKNLNLVQAEKLEYLKVITGAIAEK